MITIFKKEDKLPLVVYDVDNKTVKIAGIISPENPLFSLQSSRKR
jgi:hypothetical protein